MRALQLLAKRLMEQNKDNPTHISIKRYRSGRSVFKVLYNSTQLQNLTIESFANELYKLVKKKKYIHLVARPSRAVLNSFEESHLLK